MIKIFLITLTSLVLSCNPYNVNAQSKITSRKTTKAQQATKEVLISGAFYLDYKKAFKVKKNIIDNKPYPLFEYIRAEKGYLGIKVKGQKERLIKVINTEQEGELTMIELENGNLFTLHEVNNLLKCVYFCRGNESNNQVWSYPTNTEKTLKALNQNQPESF